jgi:hypothetical protein
VNLLLKKHYTQVLNFLLQEAPWKCLEKNYDTNINGWMKALRKELKTIIDNATLDPNTRPEDGEPIIATTETNKIKLNSEGSKTISTAGF